MSIATETARIKGNVAAALAAVAEKGVTVPDGSTSDALAELIASIDAGGGDTLLGYNLLSGTITLSEETTGSILLLESSGAKDSSYGFCALWHSNMQFVGGVLNDYIDATASTGGTSFAITAKGNNANTYKMLWLDMDGKLTLYQNSTYKLKPGVMYCWIMLYR